MWKPQERFSKSIVRFLINDELSRLLQALILSDIGNKNYTFNLFCNFILFSTISNPNRPKPRGPDYFFPNCLKWNTLRGDISMAWPPVTPFLVSVVFRCSKPDNRGPSQEMTGFKTPTESQRSPNTYTKHFSPHPLPNPTQPNSMGGLRWRGHLWSAPLEVIYRASYSVEIFGVQGTLGIWQHAWFPRQTRTVTTARQKGAW